MDSVDSSGNKNSSSAANSIEEKMKNVEVKTTPSSVTSVLVKNTVLVPSGVARVKQIQEIQNSTSSGSNPVSSGSATGNPRNKTALAPGHSLMDWIRLGSSGVDLTGVGGIPRIVSPSELAKHNKQNDAWIAIRGVVFNVTKYMDFHPGGISELMKGVGKDATKLFEDVHAWVNYQSILQKCVVGRLSRTSGTGSVSEKSITSNSTDQSSIGLLTSCTKSREVTEKIPEIKLDWRQTTNAVTISYKVPKEHRGVGYRLNRLSDSKINVGVILEREIVNYAVEFHTDVCWGPKWTRNFDTMEVEFTFQKKIPQLWKSFGTHTVSLEEIGDKRSYREYEIVSNTPICKLVNLLILESKGYLELPPIGRHLEAKMTIMGMEVSRLYTPVPAFLHPEDEPTAYKPTCICLMIKRYPNGVMTPSITALEKSQTVTLSDCFGKFLIEQFDDFPVINMLAAGTGLTPMLGIIQRALCRRNVREMKLVNFNRNQDNIFYSKELERISNDRKLKVTQILSEPDETWDGRRGNLTNELLEELFGKRSSEACVFTCGPKGFMESAKEILQNLGWEKGQIYEFDS